MATVPIYQSGTATLNASTSQFFPIISGSLVASTTEANRANKWFVPGIFTTIQVTVTVNNTTSGGNVVRFRKNSNDGNQTFSIPTNPTTGIGVFKLDLVNSDRVVSGDTVGILIQVGVGGTMIVSQISVLFTPLATGTMNCLGHIGTGSISSASIADTQFLSLLGRFQNNGTSNEEDANCKIGTPGVLKYIYARVSANARTTDTVLKLRKNNSTTGTLQLTITGATIGDIVQASPNTETINAGDRVCLCYATGTGTETLTIQMLSIVFETTDGTSVLTAFGDGMAPAVADGATEYFTFGAGAHSATESDYRAAVNVPMNISKLWVFVDPNATTSPSTVTIRKNGTNGNQTVIIPAGTAGSVEAVASVDAFALASDEIDVRVVNGGGGALNIRALSVLTTDPPARRTVLISG